MKKSAGIILACAVFAMSGSVSQAAFLNLSQPTGLGLLFVGTRQDASQIHSSGLGPGVEIFLKYGLGERFSVTGATGFFSATDDILKSSEFKTVFLPSLELRFEYSLMNGRPFRPFLYSGFHFFGASTKSSRETDSGNSYATSGSALLGLGAEFNLGSPKYNLYMGWDYRYAGFSESKEKEQYWVAKAGVSLNLGGAQLADQGQSIPLESEMVFQTFQDEKSGGEVSSGQDSFSSLSEKIEKMEDFILQNSQDIQKVSARLDSIDIQSRHLATVDSEEKNNSDFVQKYRTGLENYSKDNYDDALIIFLNLIEDYPDHELTSNCYYWIGEIYYCQGKYQDAILAFDNVFEFKSSYKQDDALLMKGQCYRSMNLKEMAATNFKALLEQFPDSEYKDRAEKYLQAL